MNEFLGDIPNLIGIAALMFSTFLIGYFYAFWAQKNHFGKIVKNLSDQVQILKGQLTKKEQELQRLYEEDELEAEMEEKMLSKQEDAPIIRTSAPSPRPAARPAPPLQQAEREPKPERTERKAAEPRGHRTKGPKELHYLYPSQTRTRLRQFWYGQGGQKDDLTKINGIGPLYRATA